MSVSNDLATDQRVRKQCASMMEIGCVPLLIGRLLPDSMPIDRPYPVKRMKLWFNKGPLFYAELNIRLFFGLLTTRASALYANDLDTLPANAMVSFLRRLPLIYDSHEFFTEVPEIRDKPKTKWIWKFLERTFIRRADLVITVSPSISGLLRRTYRLREVLVVRNVPDKIPVIEPMSRAEIGADEDVFLLIMQGSGINVDRGAEELVGAMSSIKDAVLMIIGGGDAIPDLKRMVSVRDIEDRVIFKPKMPYLELMRYTAAADLGVSIDKNTNVNYRYSLPNKIFDYIIAGTPLLVSDLVEVRRLVEENDVGYILPAHDSQTIAETIKEIRNHPDRLAEKRVNCLEAAQRISWEEEFRPVLQRLEELIV